MSDKKRFLDKDYTRRQFLKLSGKSLAGVAMSGAMLSALLPLPLSWNGQDRV